MTRVNARITGFGEMIVEDCVTRSLTYKVASIKLLQVAEANCVICDRMNGGLRCVLLNCEAKNKWDARPDIESLLGRSGN